MKSSTFLLLGLFTVVGYLFGERVTVMMMGVSSLMDYR